MLVAKWLNLALGAPERGVRLSGGCSGWEGAWPLEESFWSFSGWVEGGRKEPRRWGAALLEGELDSGRLKELFLLPVCCFFSSGREVLSSSLLSGFGAEMFSLIWNSLAVIGSSSLWRASGIIGLWTNFLTKDYIRNDGNLSFLFLPMLCYARETDRQCVLTWSSIEISWRQITSLQPSRAWSYHEDTKIGIFPQAQECIHQSTMLLDYFLSIVTFCMWSINLI